MKKQFTKQLLSLLLVLVMVAGMLPLPAYGAVSGEGWYINDENILVVEKKLTELPKYSYYEIIVLSIGELALADSTVWKYEVTNQGTISGGTFQGAVENVGNISGGTFQGAVENRSTISGGMFYGAVKNIGTGKISGGEFRSTVENVGYINGGTFREEVKNEYNGYITGGTFIHFVTNNYRITDGTFRGAVINNGYIGGGTFENSVANQELGTIEGGTFSFYINNNGEIVKVKIVGAEFSGNDPQSVIHNVSGEDKALAYGKDLLAELGQTQEGMIWFAGETCVSGGTVPLDYTQYTQKAHTHDYGYTVNGNTLTETCLNGCGHTAKATLTTPEKSYTYTGEFIMPAVLTLDRNWKGNEGKGYTYINNKDVGVATVTADPSGKTISTTFEIKAADIADATVNLDPTNGNYDGNKQEPTVSVVWNGKQLTENTDYTLSWDKTGFTDADTYTVTVTGKGNFTGTKKAVFSIDPADIKDAVVTLDQNTFVYDGQPHKPTVIVTYKGDMLTEGEDYELYNMSEDQIDKWENGEPVSFFGNTSSDSINAGQYYAIVRGKGNFADNGRFAYAKYVIKKATVTEPTIASKVYTGSVQTADITDTELYTVTQNNGDENAGNYDVVLKLKDSANYKWSTTDNAQVTLQFAITCAENAWTATPWIIGWTYGKTAKTPVGEAKFGDVSIQYAGTANDGTTYNNTTAPTDAGYYKATFIVQETENYKGLEASADFTIAKATYNMTGARWNYIAPFQYDGKEHKVEVVGLPAGVSVESYENNTATAVGDYYAKVTLAYDADNYNAPAISKLGWTIYNDWTPTEYNVNGSGWMNKDFVISAKSGYKVSLTNTANGTWQAALTYRAETEVGSVTFYLKNETDGTISLAKTVSYKLDKTVPTGKVEFVDRAAWEKFVNTITFGLFYKDEVTVQVTANDILSGVAKIEYASSDKAMTLDEVKEITDWTEYNGEFGVTLEDAKKFVYFVRITDKAGNVTYLSTDGAEYDTTAPVLYGIENGGVYHGDKVFKATDDNFLKIEVDGVDITNTTEGDNEFEIVADNAEHTVTVTDKAGNVTEYKITVYKKYMVTYSNGDGGSYEKEFKYGEVITIPTNAFFKDTFRKTGHAIQEWQGYTEGMTMPLKDLTFTAVYVPCEYTVTFEENGGEVINPITVTFGEKYGSLPSSAITGLSGGNKNWYLVDADGNVTETNIKNLTIVSTARDHKLFIKRNVLAPSVSIALTVPGGISDGYQYYIPGASTRVLTATIGIMNTDVLDYTYQWYKDGTLIEGAASNVLTLDGNVSDSGTYKVEVTAKLKDGTNIVVGSDTATASKEQKVKILHAANTLRYDANGGEGGPQSAYTGGTILNVSKDLPTREFYDFTGWNTVPDGTGDSYQAEDAYTFTNDNGNGGCEVTLYAQWKLVEYTVTYMADGESVSTETVRHGKDVILPAVPAKDGYVGKWDSDGKNIIGDTTITAVYTAIPVVKPEEVKPEDKVELEDTKKQLEDMLDDDSCTDDDKKDIQDAIDDIDDALEVIENVEAVEELIDKLSDTIKKDDEPAIKAADNAYNALTDYEKSLVDEDAKKALADAKAALAELNKPADTDSPQTGDNSNKFLWIALLFISGGAVIILTVIDKKRKASKR